MTDSDTPQITRPSGVGQDHESHYADQNFTSPTAGGVSDADWAELMSSPPAPYTLALPAREAIPMELVERKSWVAYEIVYPPGKAKPDKRPISAITGSRSAWNQPPAWADFDTARAYAQARGPAGVGLVLKSGGDLIGGDLDHCRDPATGTITPEAQRIIERTDTYTEISPGLEGLRFFAIGSFGGHTGIDRGKGVEFYEGGRFLTVTGLHLPGTPFAVNTRDLTALGREYFGGQAADPALIAFESVDLTRWVLADHTRATITTGDVTPYGGDRSKAIFGLAKDLLRAGLTDAEVCCVLCDPEHGISAGALERRDGDLASAMDWAMKYAVAPARREVAAELVEEFGPTGASLDPGRETLVEVNLTDLATAVLAAPDYLVAPILPRGEVTLLGGHGGAGKSTLALSLAACIAVGRDWGALRITAGRVLYLSLEDGGERCRWRLQKICRQFRLDPAQVAAGLTVLDGSEAGPLATEDARRLKWLPLMEQVRARAVGFDLVILDNASDACDADENSRRQVRAFVRGVGATVRGHGGAVLLLAHIDKNRAKYGAQGNSYSGSTACHNSARSRVALISKSEGGGVQLVHEKLNFGMKLQEPLDLYWSESGVLVPDAGGFSRADARAAEAADDEAAVLAALVEAAACGENVSTSTTGSATGWHKIAALPSCPDSLRVKSGKGRLEAALLRLAVTGRVRRETYRNTQRREVERWVVGTTGGSADVAV